MVVETEEIDSFLQDFCLNADEVILNKMKEICFVMDWTAEEIVDHWVAFSMSTSKQCVSPTVKLLELMEKEEQNKSNNPKSKKSLSSVTTPVFTSNDIHLISDTDFSNSEMEKKSSCDNSPMFSPKSMTPTSFTPSRKYSIRTGSGDAVCSFGNLQDIQWQQSEEFSCDIYNEKFALQNSYNYMNEKLRDRASILNDMIQFSADIFMKGRDVEEFRPVHLPSADTVTVVGRICSDTGGRLNASSLILESSQELSSGQTVPLDVSRLEQFSFFPGQIVAGTGTNSLGKKFIMETMLEPVVPEFKNQAPDLANCLDSLSLVVAAGPFATSDTFSYEPLFDLIKYVNTHKPHVLILIGPIVDIKNEAIENGVLNDTYEEVFQRVMAEIIVKTEDLSAKIVLVPSTRDAHHDCIYPTPPYTMDRKPKRVFLASDPCLLNIEGVIFGITSTDILFQLGKEEVSHPQLPDRLGRLCGHILSQRNFYPLYPPSDDINIDFLHYELHANLPIMPHVLLVPSDFRYFIKDINGCCCINPERLTKHSAGGTFARIKIKRPDAQDYSGSITKFVQAQIVKI